MCGGCAKQRRLLRERLAGQNGQIKRPQANWRDSRGRPIGVKRKKKY